jgi:hypothetical protein
MKQTTTVTIIFEKNGNPGISVEGAPGDSCLKTTKSLEEALGKVTERKATAEMGKKSPDLRDYTKVGT